MSKTFLIMYIKKFARENALTQEEINFSSQLIKALEKLPDYDYNF